MYAEPEDLPKIWHKVLTTNLVPDEIVAFIGHADNLINAALARRYTVPFASSPDATPPLIRQLSATLALLEVVDRAPSTPEWVLRKIERAEKLLDMLASGELALVGIDGTLVAERTDIGGIQSTTADYVPTFGVQPSLDEAVDPDRAQAEADARDA